MPNANIELARSRVRFVSYLLKISFLEILLKFAPRLVDRFFNMQATERIVEYPFIHENISLWWGGVISWM